MFYNVKGFHRFFLPAFYIKITSTISIFQDLFCSVPTDKQSQEQATNKIINEQISQLLLLNLTIANNS